MTEVIINGKKYYEKPESGDIRIVVLQRGWAMVGRYRREGEFCYLDDASVIRNWGTTKGLGELAKDGPNFSTKLDSTNGVVEFHVLTSLFTITVEQEKWSEIL